MRRFIPLTTAARVAAGYPVAGARLPGAL